MTRYTVPLEVITRHFPSREAMLVRQRASLAALPKGSWQQSVLYDPARRGVNASYVRLRTFEPYADWAWILDDDDLLGDPGFLDDLAGPADMHVYQMRFQHDGRLLPESEYIDMRKVQRRHIGAPCVVVRRALWMAARMAFTNRHEGEYEFIQFAISLAEQVDWHQRVIAEIDGPHSGRWRIAS